MDDLSTSTAGDPHGGMPVQSIGEPLESSKLAIILLHGRGSNAADMLGLAEHLDRADVTYIAPNAAGSTWYPASFLAPTETNHEGVESAHRVIESLVDSVARVRDASLPVALLGFSQGACLAADHAFRFPRRYAFIASLTGGLIGPPGTAFASRGSLEGTPVFLGASEPDPHVPWARVEESAAVLQAMEGDVNLIRYPNAPHAVVPDQVERVRQLIDSITSVSQP